jgi:hypothetical protein
MKPPASEFSQLVHKIVIVERRGILRDLATTLGLTYGAFYNRLIGRAEFNPREINLLLRELADPRLATYLMSGTGFFAIHSNNPSLYVIDNLDDLIKAVTFALETLTKLSTQSLPKGD